MNMSILNLNDIFGLISSERWTIVEASLANDGRHGIAMGQDAPPGKTSIIGELHWSLCTGKSFSASVSKFLPVFKRVCARITVFR